MNLTVKCQLCMHRGTKLNVFRQFSISFPFFLNGKYWKRTDREYIKMRIRSLPLVFPLVNFLLEIKLNTEKFIPMQMK